MNNFKEQLMMDANKNNSIFKAKITFDGMDFFIYDYFDYEGIKYYYIIEDKSEQFKNEEDLNKFYSNPTEKIRIEFIFEFDKVTHTYKTVTDIDLLNKLNIIEAKRLFNKNK